MSAQVAHGPVGIAFLVGMSLAAIAVTLGLLWLAVWVVAHAWGAC